MEGKQEEKEHPVMELVIRYILTLLFSAILGGLISNKIGLDRETIDKIIVVLLAILTVVGGGYFSKQYKKTSADAKAGESAEGGAFRNALFDFFDEKFIMIFLGVLLLLIVVYSQTPSGANAKDADAAQPTPDASQKADPALQDDSGTEAPGTSAAPAEMPILRVSPSDLDDDPLMEKMDTYCGEHIREEEQADKIVEILIRCRDSIEPEPMPASEKLNGADEHDAGYAKHTDEADKHYKVYLYLNKQNWFPQYQIEFLDNSIEERKEADKAYQLCDNEILISLAYVDKADVHKKNGDDNMKQFECLKCALDYAQRAYRAFLRYGSNEHTAFEIFYQIKDIGERIQELGLETWEAERAVVIAEAYMKIEQVG